VIKSVRLVGEQRGYEAAVEANEDVLPEQFGSDDEFLDTFFDSATEYEDSTRELEDWTPVGDEIVDEESEDEIWESYQIGVRLGIKRRWQEVMGMFEEGTK
jgi:hypothetical protein